MDSPGYRLSTNRRPMTVPDAEALVERVFAWMDTAEQHALDSDPSRWNDDRETITWLLAGVRRHDGCRGHNDVQPCGDGPYYADALRRHAALYGIEASS